MEDRFVDWLVKKVGSSAALDVGIGDDAAVLRPPAGRRTVFCTDSVCEGVHFPAAPHYDPCQVGHKALAVNLSDIAAMGGRPEAAVVSVTLPRAGGLSIGEQLLAGMLPLSEKFAMPIVGGDTASWDGPLVVSVAMLGSVAAGRVWRRDGCRAGDLLVVTGGFGGSLAGRHLAVEPRVEEARLISECVTVHGAIDVSDGLSLDLARLMAASGCGAEIDLSAVPVHEDALVLAGKDPSKGEPLERALADGEDFELVMSMAPEEAALLLKAVAEARLCGWPGTPLTVIGRVVAGRGLMTVSATGVREPLTPKGYLHPLD